MVYCTTASPPCPPCRLQDVSTEEFARITRRLFELRQEHRDLDEAILRLADNPAMDQLQLRRMKKRKLRLRDQISWYESRLIPDLDA